MTINEKDAILRYLEFTLLAQCDQINQRMHPGTIGILYDSAYAVLNEMEASIQDIIDFQQIESATHQ